MNQSGRLQGSSQVHFLFLSLKPCEVKGPSYKQNLSSSDPEYSHSILDTLFPESSMRGSLLLFTKAPVWGITGKHKESHL